MAECDCGLSVDPGSARVGSPVDQRIGHRVDVGLQRAGLAATGEQDSGYAAHGTGSGDRSGQATRPAAGAGPLRLARGIRGGGKFRVCDDRVNPRYYRIVTIDPFAGVLSALLLSAVTSTLLVALMLRSGWPGSMVDRPGTRSLHDRPIARTGGIAVHAGWIVGAAVVGAWMQPGSPGIPLVVFVAGACLFAVSVADDRFHLPVIARLPVHLACAIGVAIQAAGTDAMTGLPGGLLMVAVALALAWGTNLYNFMDGANGLAGGMTTIGFGAYAAMAAAHEAWALSIACAAISGAALGFLRYNFGRGCIFLGDGGSIPLGFLAGALGWVGFAQGIWAWWTAALVFLPFVADATATLLARLVRRERVWQAHREHAYQRLILSGWSHRRVCAVFYPAMVGCAILAWMLQTAPVAVQAAVLLAIFCAGILASSMMRRCAIATTVRSD